jgi:RNA polymerase sigma factor (sigma-70 family)
MKKYGADEIDAIDIYQDATIVLYEKMKRGNFKLTASIQTYLNQICFNQYLARKKSSSKKMTVLTDEIDENINDWFEEYSTSKNEKIEIILRELDKLKNENDICYERIRSYYYDKLSTANIAEKFGLKDSNSAKEQLSKCRKKIKNKIGL